VVFFRSDFFVPTQIGNVVGGIALVAAIRCTQVIAGRHCLNVLDPDPADADSRAIAK
jgi:hypothetical protein